MLTKIRNTIFILVPILLGLYVRFDDLKVWLKEKPFYFFHGRVIFTGNDAFFFARYAEDFFSGRYKAGELDIIRNVPDFMPYWDPIPLISLISGIFSKLQGTYIENVSLWLVPVLSVLFVIPLFLFFQRIGFPIAGFSGAVLTAISFAYLPRTTITRLDTDSLNLFFPFVIPLFLLLFTCGKGKKKYIYAVLAGIFSYLYMWWYNQYSLLLGIFLAFILYLLIERKLKLTKEDLIGIGIFFILSNPLNLYEGFSNIARKLYSYVFLAGKKSIEGGFPNIQQWVSELQHFDFKTLGNLIIGNEILMGVGLFGLLFVFLKRWKPMILLLPFIILGFIPLIGAMRFAMYLTPFIGIGIGAIFDTLIQYIKKDRENTDKTDFALSLVFGFVITGGILFFNKNVFAYVANPKFPPPLAGDFLALKEKTEKNSWIWTWWSEGYMIEYYARRGVFVDPGSQFTPKTYFVGLSYSTDNPQYARNIILSIASIGLKGIKEELEKGVSPETIKEKAEKGLYIKPEKIKNPIYWMFTIRSIRAFDGINRVGTWDFKLQDGLKRQYQYIGRCISSSKTTVLCSRWFIDLKEGIIKVGKRVIPIKDVLFRTSKGIIRKGHYRNKGLNLVLISSKVGTHGFLMFDQPLKSMFVNMFLLRKYDKDKYELVLDDFPFAVLYKVKK